MTGPVEDALDRFGFDVANPLSVNPAEDAKGRRGYRDLLHAYSNVWVELYRAVPPHWAGRVIAWTTPLWVYLIINGLVL